VSVRFAGYKRNTGWAVIGLWSGEEGRIRWCG